MPPRDPSNSFPLNWLDVMRAAAWDPPNLPLFRSPPVPPSGSAGSENAAATTPSTPLAGAGEMPPNDFAGAYSPLQPFWASPGVGPDLQPGPAGAMRQSGIENFNDSWTTPLAFARPAAAAQPVDPLQSSDPFRAAAQAAPRTSDATAQTSSRPWWLDTIGINGQPANNPVADRWPSPSELSQLPDWLSAVTAPRAPAAFASKLKTPALDGAKLDPADLTARIIRAESGGNPNATNSASSAAGLGQFTKGTWRDVIGRHRPELGVGRSDDELQALRFDPALNQQMTRAHAEDNAQLLKASGLPITPARLYLMHFLGSGDARKMLLAAPDTLAASVVSPGGLRANHNVIVPRSGPRTAAQMLQWASQKMGMPPEPWSSQ